MHACRSTLEDPTVEDTLVAISPYIRKYHSSAYIDDLAAGEICLALGWNGDILQARDRGAAATRPVTVRYVIPKEGAMSYFDMMAIPADAPHPDNAHALLNYLMDPQVIAKVTNKVRFANGNAAALPFIEDSIKNDPGIYPDAATMTRLHPDLVESQQFSRELNRSWTRVRSGE